MRLQAAAGRPDAVRRTLSLLEARLGELGITPGPQTRALAASLLGAPLAQSPPAAVRPGASQPSPGGARAPRTGTVRAGHVEPPAGRTRPVGRRQ